MRLDLKRPIGVGGWRTDSPRHLPSIMRAWSRRGRGCVKSRLLGSGSCCVKEWTELHPTGAQNIKASNTTNELSWKEKKPSEEFLFAVVFLFIGKTVPLWRRCPVMVGLIFALFVWRDSCCFLPNYTVHPRAVSTVPCHCPHAVMHHGLIAEGFH